MTTYVPAYARQAVWPNTTDSGPVLHGVKVKRAERMM